MHPDPDRTRRRAMARRRTSRRFRPWRWIAAALCVFLVMTAGPVLVLRHVDPPTSAFMLRAKWRAMREGREDYQTRYLWLDWEKLSPNAALAVIAAEDQLFPFHAGFDLKAIRKAWEHNQRAGAVRGASTISQQVAKNLFLWPGKSLFRKGLEAWFTALIETTWSKRRTLEVYLNIAQFGDGIYGVPAAATHLLHRAPYSLSAGDAALLAAVLPNPVRLRADAPSAYVLDRRAWIVRQMRQLGGVAYLDEL
jgi:monofunctional biosynthetic peptidoglycan transglycosylase